MKTALILTLTITAMFFVVTPALAQENALPALPENVNRLVNGNFSVLDVVPDATMPGIPAAKIYGRSNGDDKTAFIILLLLEKDADNDDFIPEAWDQTNVALVRWVGGSGRVSTWINAPLMERLAEKIRMEQLKKKKTKTQL